MSADTRKPLYGDPETIYAKLMLFGTVVGMMDAHSEAFGEQEYFGLQVLLYETAKEVWPDKGKDD